MHTIPCVAAFNTLNCKDVSILLGPYLFQCTLSTHFLLSKILEWLVKYWQRKMTRIHCNIQTIITTAYDRLRSLFVSQAHNWHGVWNINKDKTTIKFNHIKHYFYLNSVKIPSACIL